MPFQTVYCIDVWGRHPNEAIIISSFRFQVMIYQTICGINIFQPTYDWFKLALSSLQIPPSEWHHSPKKNIRKTWKQTYLDTFLLVSNFQRNKSPNRTNKNRDCFLAPKTVPNGSQDWLEYLCSNKARPKGVRWWESKAFVQQQKHCPGWKKGQVLMHRLIPSSRTWNLQSFEFYWIWKH